MKTLSITESEESLLKELLSLCLSDLRMEIADTDNSFFKETLRERKGAMAALLEKIAPKAEAAC